MKKLLSAILVLALFVGLCACNATPDITLGGTGKTEPAATTAPPVDTVSAAPVSTEATQPATTLPAQTQEPTAAPTVEDYVGVYASDHIAYTDSVGNSYDADYQIPMLLLNSEDAREANEELQRDCMRHLEQAREARDSGYSLVNVGIEYEAYLYDNYLTLVVCSNCDWDMQSYWTYCFDLTTGEDLDTEDFARYLNLSEDELETKIRSTMMSFFEEKYDAAPKDDFYNRQLGFTGSEENVDEAELYFTENGEIYVHCVIGSLAGADCYEHLIPLVY